MCSIFPLFLERPCYLSLWFIVWCMPVFRLPSVYCAKVDCLWMVHSCFFPSYCFSDIYKQFILSLFKVIKYTLKTNLWFILGHPVRSTNYSISEIYLIQSKQHSLNICNDISLTPRSI